MPQPAWRLIVERKKIPDPQDIQWTQVLDYASPGKLLKIVNVEDASVTPHVGLVWQPKDFPDTGCSADGDYANKQTATGTPLLPSAPRGALIGRIGGSTADQTVDTSTPPTRILFAVGRLCVLMVPASPVGALFLGINDLPENMGKIQKSLLVNVYEAL
jgi:hypothetical protein